MFTNILCPLDFSPDSERALEVALSLARATDGHVTIMTVVDPFLSAGVTAAGARAALEEQTQQELKQLLERVGPTMSKSAMAGVTVSVGEPPTEILAQAAECKADVIVMGMRGVGEAEKFFLGSTSQQVLESATVPVLVVPPRVRQ